MANTFTQIYVQIVFAVKGRENLISEKNRQSIEKYICGIVNNKKSKPLSIYCNPDHIHILIGLNPETSISDMARDIKSNSSKWINDNSMISKKFNWQRGYGAFTHSKSQINSVVKYILNQEEHHRKINFEEEYKHILQENEIPFDERYLFNWYHI